MDDHHNHLRNSAEQQQEQRKTSKPSPSPPPVQLYTLIFLMRNHSDVLLGYKTRGLGVDYWNGFGGKVEPAESIHDGAKRELKEESNLEAELTHVGVVRYDKDLTVADNNNKGDCGDGEKRTAIVHIFTSTHYTGRIVESEEMCPIKWFPIGAIPYDKMWPDARIWYPLMLDAGNGRFFAATFHRDWNGKIVDYKIDTYGTYEQLLAVLDKDKVYSLYGHEGDSHDVIIE